MAKRGYATEKTNFWSCFSPDLQKSLKSLTPQSSYKINYSKVLTKRKQHLKNTFLFLRMQFIKRFQTTGKTHCRLIFAGSNFSWSSLNEDPQENEKVKEIFKKKISAILFQTSSSWMRSESETNLWNLITKSYLISGTSDSVQWKKPYKKNNASDFGAPLWLW